MCFNSSTGVKPYHADSARSVILIVAYDQITFIALSGYLLADPQRAFPMEKREPTPQREESIDLQSLLNLSQRNLCDSDVVYTLEFEIPSHLGTVNL